jgi:thioredoxin reductase (NADPH)
MTTVELQAFPTLAAQEIAALRPFGESRTFTDGATVFRAGQPEMDLFVVESGNIDILNPADENRLVTTHEPGTFSGDIDLLTGRPPIVTGVARGATRLLRVPGSRLREILNRIPQFGEKLMNAFTRRRELLTQLGAAGLKVVGPGHCKDTALVREFLYKSFVPFNWIESTTPQGQAKLVELEKLAGPGSSHKSPVIQCGDGTVLINPSLQELAKSAGIWQACPDQDVEFAVVGAGPAGIAAAVYAASEGVSTVVLDRLGPGGQASGSSRIENFIGFPAGLSGMDLAQRGVLQMMKFGAKMVAPVQVNRLEAAASEDLPHVLHLDCGARIRAYTVLAATGVRWRKLEAANAARYEGAGIYYVCTSVEALLYDKTAVAVVGAGNSAGQAVMYLAGCCPERQVHMLIRNQLGPGMSRYLVDRIRATPNISVREGVEIAAVQGDGRLRGVQLKGKGAQAGEQLAVAAVFVFIGAEPAVPWLGDAVARDPLGYVLAGTEAVRSGRWPLQDRDPCPLETTVPRVLAAGDIRSGSTKRVGFAVGDGSLAVTCAHRLLALRKPA